MTKGIVIVGWPGIGKTELVKKTKGWIELETNGVPTLLILERLQHAIAKGQNVLLPIRLKLRDALSEAGIDYTLVVPSRDLKSDYIHRLIKRGEQGKVVFEVEKNWDIWMDSCLGEPCFNILTMPRSGDYLSDYIPEIMAKYEQA
jgi:hypothetical protein